MMLLSFLTVGAIAASLGLVAAENTKNVTSDSYSLEQLSTVAQAIDESFNVTGFEKKLPVSIEESDLKATLYDFSGDEGYMLLGDNYQIFDFKAGVDLVAEYKQCDNLVFNNVSKTYKSVGDDGAVSVDLLGEGENAREDDNSLKSASYVGEGKIESYELQGYINSFFPGSVLDSSYSVPMKRFNQNEISVYNCGGASEANCWLCASYTGLYNLMFEGSYSSSMYESFRSCVSVIVCVSNGSN